MWRGALIFASAYLVVLPHPRLPLSAQEITPRRVEIERRADPYPDRLSPAEREKVRRRLEETFPRGERDIDTTLRMGPAETTVLNTRRALEVKPPGNGRPRLFSLRDMAFDQFAAESLRSPEEIKTTQAWLAELGYYHGPPDGVVGPLTRAAIAELQMEEGHFFLSRDSLSRAALKKYASLSREFQSQLQPKMFEWLADLGFPQRDQPSEEVVREYQQFRAITPTGSIDPETVSAINEDLGLFDQVLEMPYSDLSSLTLGSGARFSGYLRDNNKFYFLVRRSTPELWVMNAAQGRLEKPVAGAEAIDQFHSAGRSIAAKNTRGDRKFLYATPQGANSPVDLQVGSQRFFLTRDEFASLLQSPQAPSQLDKAFDFGGATKPTVVVSGDDNSTTAIAGLVKARYGQTADVFLARDPSAISEHLNALPSLSIRSASDLVVYTAKNITDYGTMANLKKSLASARIRLVEETGGSASERSHALNREQWSASNVIVIAGHRDSKMADHLMDLKYVGALKGKLVVVASCYEPGVELLQSALTAGYQGAAGVLFFRETIKASAVESVMLQFTKLMRSGSFDPARIDDLLRRSVDLALERAETPSEREEIEKLRHPILQISRFRLPSKLFDA